ncbi:hypothetical protein [Planomonospora algeriensis]
MAAALHLPGRARPGLAEALGGGVGELVEVDEDGLAQVVQLLRGEPEVLGLLGQAPPGHPGAQAHRGLQRVEVAALVGLAAPDRAEHVGLQRPAGVLDPVHELAQRLVHGQPYDLDVGLVGRPGVFGDAQDDLVDHLLGDPGQARPEQPGHRGRGGAPEPLVGHRVVRPAAAAQSPDRDPRVFLRRHRPSRRSAPHVLT